jgi:hypothetical protein
MTKRRRLENYPTTERKRMDRITRLRPSPALVVATIALLVALGGTSAAAVALLPRNSVGSVQVIDGSLKSRDFHAGVLPAQTVVFSRSVAGPVTINTGDSDVSDPRLSVATLTISRPGTYLLSAKGRFTVDDAEITCALIAGDSSDTSSANVPTRPVGGEAFKATLSHLAVHVFAEPGDVDLRCTTPGKGTAFAARDVTLVAIGSRARPARKHRNLERKETACPGSPAFARRPPWSSRRSRSSSPSAAPAWLP